MSLGSHLVVSHSIFFPIPTNVNYIRESRLPPNTSNAPTQYTVISRFLVTAQPFSVLLLNFMKCIDHANLKCGLECKKKALFTACFVGWLLILSHRFVTPQRVKPELHFHSRFIKGNEVELPIISNGSCPRVCQSASSFLFSHVRVIRLVLLAGGHRRTGL